jgi:nicotinamide-nucleotide amidase
MYIKVFGVGESKVEDMLKDLIDNQTSPTIATYAKLGEVEVRITASGKSEMENQVLLKNMEKEIESRLGDSIYSLTGESIQEAVGSMLIDKNITFSFAESCTGGLLSSMITEINGISKVFNRGIVTYSNEAKMSELGVKKETLDKYGAVSQETAREMATGLFEITKSDVCVSITGIAGPEGGSEEKPVGLVYIGICYLGNCHVEKFNFRGDRNRIRNYSALNCLNLIRKIVNK